MIIFKLQDTLVGKFVKTTISPFWDSHFEYSVPIIDFFLLYFCFKFVILCRNKILLLREVMIMNKIINISISLILIISNFLIAQDQDSWTTFTTSDGLASDQVYAIHEDIKGALWFGTRYGGVSRYQDGTWTTFNTSHGLVHNEVFSICETKDGALWFGTLKGVSRYQNRNWTSYKTVDGIALDWVVTFCEASDGILYFGTYNRIIRYQNGIMTVFTEAEGVINFSVEAICETRDGALWFGTAEEGIHRFYNGTWRLFTTFDGLVHNQVNAILESSNGALWIGTNGGVSRYQDGVWTTFDISNGLPNDVVCSICETIDDVLWFGTRFGGVCRYQDKTWKTFNTADGLVSDEVNTICATGDWALWFGTPYGVTRYQEKSWTRYTEVDGLCGNQVNVIFESRDEALWFGTRFEGVSRYFDGTWTTFNTNSGLANDEVLAICETRDGALWFGTIEGVSRYQDRIWTTFTSDSGLAFNQVYAIIEDRNGVLWFGTRGGGVSRYFNDTWTTFKTDSGLVHNEVFSICETKDGALWFGTLKGVSRYQDGNWTSFKTVDGITLDWVVTFCESRDGILYFGTYNRIIRYQNGIMTIFTEAEGVLNISVESIYETRDGALWFGTYGLGISRYYNESWQTFTTFEGLIDNEVNVIYESSNGTLWIGTNGGVSKLKPDKHPPFTYIIEGPQNNYIIGISSPMFVFNGKDDRTAQDQLFYSFMVTDTNGIRVSGDSLAFLNETVSQIVPLINGTYTFSVRARDSWGNIDPTPATRTFTVDITQPTTTIEYPKHNDTINDIITIRGTVYDDSPIKDFKYYGICYGKGTDKNAVSRWDTLVYPNSDRYSIRNDSLAILDTDSLELRGPYQLKLFAKDTLDHASEDIITVHIVDFIGEIRNREGGHVNDVKNKIVVYFPPNSFDHDKEIHIELLPDLNIDGRNENSFRYAGLAFDIMPTDIITRKPGTLSLTYADSNLANVNNEKKLSIYRYNENKEKWLLIGGTVEVAHNKIVTSITQLGRYGLFENLDEGTESSLSEVDIQPRVFSPQGGGFNTQAAISFMLGKDANVTIKIYNIAGRLVRLLKANEWMSYGNKVVYWDGKDKQGNFCPSDMYLVTIQALDKVVTKTVGILDRK